MEGISAKEAGAAVNRNEKAVLVSASRPLHFRIRRKPGKHNVLNKREGVVKNPETPKENDGTPAKHGRASFKRLKSIFQHIVEVDNPDAPFNEMNNAQRQELLANTDPPENTKSNHKKKDGIADEWTDFEHYSDERDYEWLGVDEEYKADNTAPSTSGHDTPRSQLDEIGNLDQGCEEYMASMKYFWWSLYLGGRMPFQTYVEDNIVKFKLNMHSLQFIYFAITSIFLTICTTTMGYSFFRIFFVSEEYALNFYEKVERLEVDKYWIFIVVTFSSSAIASCWSLATMFDDGAALAEFLTRWNLAISVLKYRPVAKIRLYFWLNSSLFVLYVGFVVLMFTTDSMPIVRNASGLVGLTIFRPFTSKLRFSRNYPHVEQFGLFVHLYAVFSARCIMHMAILYCKLLVNCARKWNLRLAYVMGYLESTAAKKREKIVALISYQKLFTEHTIIVGFLRHTGRVFAVALGIYYTLKVLEFLAVLYHLFSLIVYPPLKFNMTHVEETPNYLRPISYTDPRFMTIMTVLFLLAHGFLVWIMMTEQIASCGEALLDGFSFIRRCGLILSQTTERRRFVLSFTNGFSSVTDYYVRVGYTINRAFTYEVFFWLATFTGLLMAFHPFHLQKELITVCGANGQCVSIARTSIAWRTSSGDDSKQQMGVIIRKDIEAQEKEISNSTIIISTQTPPVVSLSSAEPLASTTTTLPTTKNPTTRTPTATETSITITSPKTGSYACDGNHEGRPVQVHFVEVCTIFKPSEGEVRAHPFEQHGKCPTEDYFTPPFEMHFIRQNGFLRTCSRPEHDSLVNKIADHCSSRNFDNIKTGTHAIMKPTKVVLNGGLGYVLCCYDYGFGEEQLQHCNQVFTNSDIADRCKIKLPEENTACSLPFKFDDNLSEEIRGCIEGKKNPSECGRVDKCLCGDNYTMDASACDIASQKVVC